MATKKSVSFMDALQQTATPYRKVMITPMRDPMTRMRNKLTDSIMAQITAIDAGEKETRWYKQEADGSVVISFRNGNTVMLINGNRFFKVPDLETAKDIFTKAFDAVANGEFNDALKDSAPKPRKRKQVEV